MQIVEYDKSKSELLSEFVRTICKEDWSMDWLEPTMDTLLKNMTYIAVLDGDVAGVINIKKYNKWTYDITELMIRKGQRLKGIGKKLVEYVKSIAEKDGAEILTVHTGTNLPEAMAFYIKIGFKPTGLVHDFCKKDDPQIFFSVRLKP